LEFRSKINEIDKILTRLPTLQHMAFGLEMAQAQTALASMQKELAGMVAQTKDRGLQHIVDFMLCLQPYSSTRH
jgi:23S rRNA maturation-related 3'-5' exoribonuclease YhaM